MIWRNAYCTGSRTVDPTTLQVIVTCETSAGLATKQTTKQKPNTKQTQPNANVAVVVVVVVVVHDKQPISRRKILTGTICAYRLYSIFF